jgi:hypothetical protein
MLGALDLEVPEYVELVQDPEAKSVLLSVQDNEAKDQKAMWGRFIGLSSSWIPVGLTIA